MRTSILISNPITKIILVVEKQNPKISTFGLRDRIGVIGPPLNNFK